MSNDTTKLTDELVARVLISELVDEFYSRIDRRESTADLLTDDATFKTPNRDAEGRSGVAELLLNLADVRKEKGRESRHFGSNVSISSLGDGRYRVRSLVIVFSLDSQPTTAGVLNMGEHDDIVVIDDASKARFASRAMTPVLQLGLTA
jgi:SnoaL-like domain